MKNSRLVLALLVLIALAATGFSAADAKTTGTGKSCCAAGPACDGCSAGCCGK